MSKGRSTSILCGSDLRGKLRRITVCLWAVLNQTPLRLTWRSISHSLDRWPMSSWTSRRSLANWNICSQWLSFSVVLWADGCVNIFSVGCVCYRWVLHARGRSHSTGTATASAQWTQAPRQAQREERFQTGQQRETRLQTSDQPRQTQLWALQGYICKRLSITHVPIKAV